MLHYIYRGGPGSSVGTATAYGLDGPGRFFALVQTGPEARPASCTMGTGSFPEVSCGRGIRYDNELCKLMGGEYIVRFKKAQRIQWLGHVERLNETAMPKRVLKGKLYAMRRIGRPRKRWLEDVIADLRRMGIS